MSTLLPELPEPFCYHHQLVMNSSDGIVDSETNSQATMEPWLKADCRVETIALLTADQVRAIQREAWRAAIKHAESIAKAHAALPVDAGMSGFSGSYLDGYGCAAGIIAETLAGLPSPE